MVAAASYRRVRRWVDGEFHCSMPDPSQAPHVLVEYRGVKVKFWLVPRLHFARPRPKMRTSDQIRIWKFVEAHRSELLEEWTSS